MRLSTRPVIALLVVAVTAGAADWPQFHGPNRDNKSDGQGIVATLA